MTTLVEESWKGEDRGVQYTGMKVIMQLSLIVVVVYTLSGLGSSPKYQNLLFAEVVLRTKSHDSCLQAFTSLKSPLPRIRRSRLRSCSQSATLWTLREWTLREA